MKQKLEKLEQDMREVGRSLIQLTVFMNLLIKKSGLTDVEIQSAFEEANKEYAESQRVRSPETGTNERDSRLDSGVFGAPNS